MRHETAEGAPEAAFHRASSPHAGATIIRVATTLSGLPLPTEVALGDLRPWSVITTTALVALLKVDRGNFATWRCRGIGPAELPASWFKAASGRPCYYMVSDILGWLASRHGEPFDGKAFMLDYLRTNLGTGFDTAAWVRTLAESSGPVQGSVRFTPAGFQAYLSALIL